MPATFTNGFGRVLDSGAMRVPRPAANSNIADGVVM
jgi:hypothetical protein